MAVLEPFFDLEPGDDGDQTVPNTASGSVGGLGVMSSLSAFASWDDGDGRGHYGRDSSVGSLPSPRVRNPPASPAPRGTSTQPKRKDRAAFDVIVALFRDRKTALVLENAQHLDVRYVSWLAAIRRH